MGRFSKFWLHQFVNWDRASQTGFLMAIGLFITAIVVAISGPDVLRGPAMFGSVGLVIAAQSIFLWANRGMVTEYTKAQRLYLKGEFDSVILILEPLRDDNQADLRTLVLLGNTYRQLGELDKSNTILLEAISKDETHPFVLYGLGRTRLAQGQYEESAALIEKALENGAVDVCLFDAGEAHYRQGNTAQAVDFLKRSHNHILKEPHRVLMMTYLLYKLNSGQAPSENLVDLGIAYWQTQAKIFAQSPYGAALKQDIAAMTSGDN